MVSLSTTVRSEMVGLVSRSNLEEMMSSEHLRKPKKARMNSDGRSKTDGQTSPNVGWKR